MPLAWKGRGIVYLFISTNNATLLVTIIIYDLLIVQLAQDLFWSQSLPLAVVLPIKTSWLRGSLVFPTWQLWAAYLSFPFEEFRSQFRVDAKGSAGIQPLSVPELSFPRPSQRQRRVLSYCRCACNLEGRGRAKKPHPHLKCTSQK